MAALFFCYLCKKEVMKFTGPEYEQSVKTISIDRANRLGLLIMVPVFVGVTAIHLLFWGTDLLDYFRTPKLAARWFHDGLGFSIVCMVGIGLHELIHGITWALFSPSGFRSVRFGVLKEWFTPYCHCTEPLKINHYRLGAIMPAIFLGVVPIAVGIAVGYYRATLFGIFFTVAAIGDFMVLQLLRGEKPDDYAQDHPTEAGCYVFRRKESPLPSSTKN